MEERSTHLFRRKKGSLMWHFRDDCNRYPSIDGFVSKHLSLPLGFQLVCAVCKRLEREELAANTATATG